MKPLYNEELVEHYKHPQHRGTLENPTHTATDHNPSCGDSIGMQLVIENNSIKKVMFTGSGCVISQASADIIAEFIQGKSKDEALAIRTEQLVELLNIELGPTRLKCALLSLQVLHEALLAS